MQRVPCLPGSRRVPTPTLCGDAEALVAKAKRSDIQPHEVDGILQRAGRVLVAGNAPAARRAYETVLRPLSRADIWLPGVDEFPDEVLTSSMYDVCAYYLLAIYEDSPAEDRVEAIAAAVPVVDALQQLHMPLRMIEEAAIRPLEGFDTFAAQWVDRIGSKPLGQSDWTARSVLEEAIVRTEGIDGLQREARAGKSLEAYTGWCGALRAGERWEELLAALREASALMTEPDEIAYYHDEAADLQARLGHSEEVQVHLNAAYEADPSLHRFLKLIDCDALAVSSCANACDRCFEPASRTRPRSLP